MSDTTLAVLLSSVPLFCFGVSNVMQKMYVKQFGTSRLLFYRNSIMVLLLVFVVIGAAVIGFEKPVFDLEGILISIFVAAVSYGGLYFMNRGFEHGKAGVIIPITSGRVLLASLIGILFLDDEVTTLQLGLVLLIFLGVVIGSLNFKELAKSNMFKIESGVPYAILSAIFWGISLPFFSVGTEKVGTLFFTLILESVVLVISFLLLKSRKQKISVTINVSKNTWLSIGAIGIVGTLGTLFTNAALNTGEISISNGIIGATPIISAVIAFFALKERLNKQQIAALIIITLSIVLLPFA